MAANSPEANTLVAVLARPAIKYPTASKGSDPKITKGTRNPNKIAAKINPFYDHTSMVQFEDQWEKAV